MKFFALSVLALACSLTFAKEDSVSTRVEAPPALLGNRADNPALAGAVRNAYGTDVRSIANDTRELANSNTFVRIQEELAGRDVVVTVPKGSNADAVMEALIKVRTAITMGARHVTAFFEEKPDLTLAKLFMVAGAHRAAHYDKEWIIDSPYVRPAPPHPFKSISRVVVIDRDHPNLADAVAKRLGVPHVGPESADLDLKSTHILFFAPSEIPVNENFFAVLDQIRKLADAGAMVTLVTPYLPYARSDKVDQPGVTVTARLIADLVESVGTYSVVFARAHSPQAQGFFRIPATQVSGIPTLKAGLGDLNIEAILAPDAGFEKDASKIAETLRLPLATLNKKREPATGEVRIMGAGGADVTGKTVLIPDDETASGSTLAEAAEYAVNRLGAKAVYGAVTHLAGDAKRAIGNPYIKKLIVTDSVHAAESVPGVQVQSLAGEFAEALKRWVRAVDCRKTLLRE